MLRFNKESGQASRMLLVLAVVILVAVVIAYLVMRMAEKPPAPNLPINPGVTQPVYEEQLGNIRFVFQSALDKGNILAVAEIINTDYINSYNTPKNLTTGEKFIKVTVGAQNKGTENTEVKAWNIQNIVDSKGRNFVPIGRDLVAPWLPTKDLCGSLLKPAFDPAPCVKIYEVSKQSTGLKIRVETGKNNKADNLSKGNTDSFLLDLIVK